MTDFFFNLSDQRLHINYSELHQAIKKGKEKLIDIGKAHPVTKRE